MQSVPSFLKDAEPAQHFVQLYGTDEAALTANIAVFLAEGFRRGNAGVIIATAAHCDSVFSGLRTRGTNPAQLLAEGRLTVIEPRETLARLIVDGEPDWCSFESGPAALISGLASTYGDVRVYGELVGLLWLEKKYEAAARLEEFWNRFLASGTFSLFCGYPIDVFGPEFRAENMETLLCAHTHLVSAGPNGDIEAALERAVYDYFGPDSDAVRRNFTSTPESSWARLPLAESVLLFLEENLPGHAAKILERAQRYYRASQLLPPGLPAARAQN